MSAINQTGALTALDRRLLLWLDTDEARFERYIAKHPEAAERVEQLVALGADAERVLNEAFTSALSAPIDLLDRLADTFSQDLSTAPGTVAMDLLGVGAATLATLFDL